MYNKETFNQENRHNSGPMGCGNGFKNKFGQFFAGAPGGRRGEHMHRHQAALHPVTIIEQPDSYLLSLNAAGLQKDNFSISVNEDILTIRYEPQPENEEKKIIYEEYRPTAFKRSFQLNGKVVTESVSAGYQNGVLEVTLPKNPEKHHPAQEININ